MPQFLDLLVHALSVFLVRRQQLLVGVRQTFRLGRAALTPLLRRTEQFKVELECRPMTNVMAALPNTGGALCSTPQSLADARYQNAVQYRFQDAKAVEIS